MGKMGDTWRGVETGTKKGETKMYMARIFFYDII